MKVSERIRRARRHAGLSQTQLSTAIAVQRSAVSNWESANEIYPTMANLIAVARICNVSLEWLGTGHGCMRLDYQENAASLLADAEIVDDAAERELLASFRALPRRAKQPILQLIRALGSSRTIVRDRQPFAGGSRSARRWVDQTESTPEG